MTFISSPNAYLFVYSIEHFTPFILFFYYLIKKKRSVFFLPFSLVARSLKWLDNFFFFLSVFCLLPPTGCQAKQTQRISFCLC